MLTSSGRIFKRETTPYVRSRDGGDKIWSSPTTWLHRPTRRSSSTGILRMGQRSRVCQSPSDMLTRTFLKGWFFPVLEHAGAPFILGPLLPCGEGCHMGRILLWEGIIWNRKFSKCGMLMSEKYFYPQKKYKKKERLTPLRCCDQCK